jgi:hypothetical protein
MSRDEDDKSTTVIDIKKLKKLQEAKDKELSKVSENLEFTLHNYSVSSSTSQESSVSNIQNNNQQTVLLFDFNQGFFAAEKDKLGQDFKFVVIKELGELNQWLKKKIPVTIMFLYESNPQGVNKLCAQIKLKFKLAKTIIVGKNFSAQKIKIHQNSPAGAQGYISLPLDANKISNLLEKLELKKAG